MESIRRYMIFIINKISFAILLSMSIVVLLIIIFLGYLFISAVYNYWPINVDDLYGEYYEEFHKVYSESKFPGGEHYLRLDKDYTYTYVYDHPDKPPVRFSGTWVFNDKLNSISLADFYLHVSLWYINYESEEEKGKVTLQFFRFFQGIELDFYEEYTLNKVTGYSPDPQYKIFIEDCNDLE